MEIKRKQMLKRRAIVVNTLSATRAKSAAPLPTSWSQIKWQKANKYVEKLQKRIFHAEKEGNKRRVRDLQRMLTKSKSALIASIRRVTQINKGKRTAGIDGYKALSPEKRLALFYQMTDMHLALHKPKPAYRTYIRKKNGKLRPLGIPTIRDRVYQNIAKLALEPQWEARFEPTSYGFRPKRSCHDAIGRIYQSLKGNNNKKHWIFEGDFKACFDTLDHNFILKQINGFPESDIIAEWLKAGFIDNNVFNVTEDGTPQGGIISPLLANIALHGMEKALGIKYIKNGNTPHYNGTKFSLCRYADDFVAMCPTKEDAENVRLILKDYLSDRGLTLAEEKTKITHIKEGFNFLGFNIRRYNVTIHKKGEKPREGKKLLTKPSKESVQTLRDKVRDEFARAKGTNAQALIGRINPIITGTANYWKPGVAKEIFNDIDHYIWSKVKRWINRSHPRKNWNWKKKRYFKPDNAGQSKDKWIFTDPVTDNQMKRMSWTEIKRHTLITHDSSPFDKNLAEYYKLRDLKEFEKNNVAYRQKLAKKQNYVCPMCKQSITDFKEGLESHHIIPKHHGGDDTYKNLQLVHISCHIDYHKAYPVKGKIPTQMDKFKVYKAIKKQRLAGIS
jgi:RNA-directed DNA polymerase